MRYSVAKPVSTKNYGFQKICILSCTFKLIAYLRHGKQRIMRLSILHGLFVVVLLAATVQSCRKKTERDVVEIDTSDEYHCYNSELDGDELGEDCGGLDCDACATTTAPCTPAEDVIRIKAWEFGPIEDKPVTSTTLDIDGDGVWEFRAYTSASDYLKLQFVAQPDITQIYQGTEFLPQYPWEYEIEVEYVQASFDNVKGTGDIYVHYTAGAYVIEACEFGFYITGESPDPDQRFNVTFD